jgi:methionyl-tRNA formyltransferase
VTDGSARDLDPAAADRVRTVFLGSGRFAQRILGRLAAHPSIDLVAVVTAPPRPVGRRQVETPTPIDSAAHELGIRVVAPRRLRDPASVAEIVALEPGLIVLADYGQIVPRELLEMPHGALNLHPSLLPRHRGATPIPAAILAGDTETGVTLIRMDDGLDTGPIVAAERVALAGDESTPALEARLAIVAAGLLARWLPRWLAGDLEPRPQPPDGATLTRPLRRGDGRLEPGTPAVVLERQVRAYLPWPGSFLDADGERVVVLAASVGEPAAGDVPGMVVADGDGLALATVNGRLVLDEVQPAGGRPMTAAAFVRGRPAIVGRPAAGVMRSAGVNRDVGSADGPPGDPAGEPA